MKPMFRLLMVVLSFSPAVAQAAEAPCSADTEAGATCRCDARTLRPLQGAIGMAEVQDKADRIAAKPNKEWRELQEDPVKVVRGSGGALFITDHHHGADAWRLAGHPSVLCQIVERPAFTTDAAFWSGLVADRLVHLADADGRPVTHDQLPVNLAAMPDDPYRSLAWRLRKAGGFCRSAMKEKEFAEFVWADWMRTRPELPPAAVRAGAAEVLPASLALARSAAAKDVDGYVGDQPAGFTCPKDP